MTDEETLPEAPATSRTDSEPARAQVTRNRLVIGVLLLAAFVVILNETVMSVAMPTLMIELDIAAATAQWLTTGFMLTMAIVIPITGYVLERFRTRSVFLVAMSLFSAGTLLAAIAPGFWVLLGARVLQAGGTATMLPLLMTTAMFLVSPAARGRTMGSIAVVISVAPAIGPTISGIILSALSWRFMFILVLPIAVAILFVGAVKLENVTQPRTVPLDIASVVLSVFGFGGLLYGISGLGEPDPSRQLAALASIAISIVSLTIFTFRQIRLARVSAPLLDLRAFRSRTFTVSILMFVISGIGLFGSLIVLPIYMQSVLGLGTLLTGFLLLPGGLVMGVLSPIVGRIYDRVGPTALLLIGSVLVCGALWTMAAALTPEAPTVAVPLLHVVLSIGLAMTFTPLFSASLGSLAPSLYSHGSAILNTVQQVAGGAGTALFVALLSATAADQVAAGASYVEATAAGVQAAFIVGASVSILAIPASFFVRKVVSS